MTHLEQAIRDAEKGGYAGAEYKQATEHIQDFVVIDMAKRLVLLHAAFWQALGRARGWEKNEFRNEPLEIWMRLIFHLNGGKDFVIALGSSARVDGPRRVLRIWGADAGRCILDAPKWSSEWFSGNRFLAVRVDQKI